MRKLLSVALVVFVIGATGSAGARTGIFDAKKKKAAKEQTVEKSDSTQHKGKEAYEKLLKDATTYKGMFNVHVVKDKYYFEIPKEILNRDYLLASRVSSISNNKDIAAGQMPRNPIHITFSADKKNVYMHKKRTTIECDTTSNMYMAFVKNYVDPIWNAYKIEAMNPDSTTYVIEVTDLFLGDVPELSPFREANIWDALMRKKPLSGSLSSSKSSIIGVKAFPQNINIKSQLTYNADGAFTTVMTRNIIMLPEKPMRPRYADPRIGYFSERRRLYTEKEDGIKEYEIINRWDIQPKPEDVERYKKGELVEPAKPIVFYVDPAIPEKWRKYIKLGIEDWQKAFEAIGFKNAIVARDYPKDDPDFDPDDIRYSCYRMITTPTQNSMGPSWIDPRSGEIIQGDVLFYSNIVRLLHDWRFVQTGAVDPDVRTSVFSDELMGSSLRYVAAHEVGHTLGLAHNFGASYAYPVDSLRSPSFTQKYGTTPSIMDYARYNYVAQPGDKERGVQLTPPDLGVYDIYAIKWGYKPIFGAKTPEDEIDTLDRWIREKANDPMYKFGPQPFINEYDPSCKAEDLGDNSVKASEYGMKNLKVIMKHLNEWTKEGDPDYERMMETYTQLWIQMQRYLMHASVSLGGIYVDMPVRNDGGRPVLRFASKEEQRTAFDFIFTTLEELPDWVLDTTVTKYTGPYYSVSTLQSIMIYRMFFMNISSSLILFEQLDPKNAYTYAEFMDDLFNRVWKKTLRRQPLTLTDRTFQQAYVEKILDENGFKKAASGSPFEFAGIGDSEVSKQLTTDPGCLVINNKGITYELNVMAETTASKNPIYYKKMMDTYALLKQVQNVGDAKTRAHYQSLLFQMKQKLENGN